MSQCACSNPGWCDRHQCHKTGHWHKLCRTNSGYFELWEDGRGPGQDPSQRKIDPPVRTVGVAIISHNYGQYAADAIESVLAQSRSIDEIVVVDDTSDDDTTGRIARSYADQGVEFIRIEAGNVHRARRTGYEVLNSDVICFLDADDRLDSRYIEHGLAEFDDYRVAVVYSDVEFIGDRTGRSSYPDEYDSSQLRYDNYMHAGSLVRRDAVSLSRVFERSFDPLVAQGDWFLWRHVLDNNWTARKQAGTYYYRKHDRNWSQYRRREREKCYFEYAALDQEDVTLFIPLSGRTELWQGLSKFLERQQWPRDQIRLVLMDTSQSGDFARIVRRWLASCDYRDVRYISERVGSVGLADDDRFDLDIRGQVIAAISHIYNRMIEVVETEYVWTLEDDILPDLDVCRRLLMGFDAKTASVAAPYVSRHRDAYVAWRHLNIPFVKPGTGLKTVGGNGFGCTIVRRSVLEQTVFTRCGEVIDFDTAFYHRLSKSGLVAKVDWSCQCEHLTSTATETLPC